MIDDIILFKLKNEYSVGKIYSLERNNTEINEIGIQLRKWLSDKIALCSLKDVECILRYRKYLITTYSLNFKNF